MLTDSSGGLEGDTEERTLGETHKDLHQGRERVGDASFS